MDEPKNRGDVATLRPVRNPIREDLRWWLRPASIRDHSISAVLKESQELARGRGLPVVTRIWGRYRHGMVVRRILAASSGFGLNDRHDWTAGPLVRAALALSAHPRAPRLAYLGTAMGDRVEDIAMVHGAFTGTTVSVSTVRLMPQPNVPDLREALLAQDVIYVGGGSVAGLLALWRLHGLDQVLREAWDAGIVLAGVSAGSICWHRGGPTDSFGPELRVIDNGLGFLPYGNGVHYDSEAARRPLLHSAVADATLPTSYATDNGVALLYEDTELVEALSERDGPSAYKIERHGHEVTESLLKPRVVN